MIKIIAIISKGFCAENDFMDIFVFFVVVFGVMVMISIINIASLIFFVLVFSLGASEIIYMNSVIIPDENVIIVTNGNQFIMVDLYRYIVKVTDIIRIMRAIVVGFFIFVVIIHIIIIIDISLIVILIYKINVIF